MRPDYLSRRRFLRGAGGAALALPFFPAQHGRAATPPERLLTVFIGQGTPPEFSVGGVDNPVLRGLKPYADRITTVRGINTDNGGDGDAHPKGSAAFACAVGTPNRVSKGGPTIDWVVHQATKTSTPVPLVSTGVWAGFHTGDERVRLVQTFRGVNEPVDPVRNPLQLFDYLFGMGAAPAPTPATPTVPMVSKADRYKRSVLDVVLEDYKRTTSPAAGLGTSVRQVISSHLESLRELERAAIGVAQTMGTNPVPMLSASCKGQTRPTVLDPQRNVGAANWDQIWPVVIGVAVMGIRCDAYRFGSLIITSGGDKFGWPGIRGDVHDHIGHVWKPGSTVPLHEVLTWCYDKVGQLLGLLDDRQFRDVDGGTLLDNTTVLIGSELGNPAAHSHKDMTHFIAGGRKRFRPGVYEAGGRTDVDFYNTVLRGLGLTVPFGEQKNFRGTLPVI